MISVIEVFNAVRDLANKDQKGFVEPAVFNSFAEVAQQTVFENIISNLVQAKSLRLRQADTGGSESLYRGIEDDFSGYVKEQVLETSRERNLSGGSNLFKKPLDFYKLISIRVSGDERTPVELVYSPGKISHILSSNLSAPTELFPVALVSKNIEVFPTDVSQVIMTYYRNPSSRLIVPTAGAARGDLDESSSPRFTVVGALGADGFYTPSVSNSRDFDLPERYKGELIAEICKMMGVRLRDTVLAQYGQTQTN